MKDKRCLSHCAMVGWYRPKLSQQKTPCPLDLMMGTAYYLKRIYGFDMSLTILSAIDCHVCVEEIKSLAKRTDIFEMAPHTGVHILLSETKKEPNRSVSV